DRCLARLSPLWPGVATRGFARQTCDLYEDAYRRSPRDRPGDGMTVRTPHEALLATLVAPLAGTDDRIKYVSLERAEAQGLVAASRLPLTLKILVEGALRHADSPLDLAGLAERPRRGSLEFRPVRLLLQDFTGIPLMTDMASLRDEIARRGGDPAKA